MKISHQETGFSNWTITSNWALFLAALVSPVLMLAGFINGSGSRDVYAALSDAIYAIMAETSWVPIVLLGLLGELLGFNRHWLRDWVKTFHVGQSIDAWLFLLEIAILSALLFCALWSGTLFGQVWAVRPGVEAFFITAGLILLLSLLYLHVVTSDYAIGVPDNQPDTFVEPTEPTNSIATANIVPALALEVPDQERQTRSAPARREQEDALELDWQIPSNGFDGLAGMEDLKGQLSAAIKGFRHYRDMGVFPGPGHNVNAGQRPGQIGAISDTNGILLSGPPGSGKTVFARAIAGELGLPFVKVGCADITSKWINQTAGMVKDLFRQAAKNQPCVVFLDEFDSIAMSRSNNQLHGEDRKLVTTLLSQIDDARKEGIVLVAASNYPEQIDAAICRDGRFDYRIDIGYPDLAARTAVLHALLEKYHVIAERKAVDQVAALWERRTVAFLDSTIKRVRDMVGERGGFKAFLEDFKSAARTASRKASALPGPGPKLSEIYLSQQTRAYSESLIYRLRNWEVISTRGGEPPRGVILYGPPGTGKSLFVAALARELMDWHIFEINGSDVSRDPKIFRDTVELAQSHRPAIVFMDECDDLMACRGTGWNASACNEILKVMDGIGSKVPEVVFMAATNRMEDVDPAALRGGRFDEQLLMDVLKGDDLKAFLEAQLHTLKSRRLNVNVDIVKLANALQAASAADIVSLVRRAVNSSLGQLGGKQQITMEHFECALRLQRR